MIFVLGSASAPGTAGAFEDQAPGEKAGAVRTYASDAGLVDSVNTHLLDTGDGLVVIDAQRLLPEAEKAVRLVRSLGEPLLAIVVTHAHTDHYGGLPVWRAAFPDTPIFASEATRASIEADAEGFNAARRARHGEMFATQAALDAALPAEVLKDGDTLSVGDVTLSIVEFRDSESPSALVLYHETSGSLFVGDLIKDGYVSPPFVSVTRWLDQLDALEHDYPAGTTVYGGHGPSGPLGEMIAGERAFLTRLDDAVAAHGKDGILTAQDVADTVFAMETTFPHRQGVGGNDRTATLAAAVGMVARQRDIAVERGTEF